MVHESYVHPLSETAAAFELDLVFPLILNHQCSLNFAICLARGESTEYEHAEVLSFETQPRRCRLQLFQTPGCSPVLL